MTTNNNYHEIIKVLMKDLGDWVEDSGIYTFEIKEYTEAYLKPNLSKQSYELLMDVINGTI